MAEETQGFPGGPWMPAARVAWRELAFMFPLRSAIFLGPLVAGVLEGAGQRVFLAVIGGGALLLGARLMWRPSP